MRFTQSFAPALLVLAGVAQAASSWGFDDGTLSVVAKKGGAGVKEKYAVKYKDTAHLQWARLTDVACSALQDYLQEPSLKARHPRQHRHPKTCPFRDRQWQGKAPTSSIFGAQAAGYWT